MAGKITAFSFGDISHPQMTQKTQINKEKNLRHQRYLRMKDYK